MSGFLATAYVNSHRDPEKEPEPIELLMPWASLSEVEPVSPEQRARLRTRLERHSAFGSR